MEQGKKTLEEIVGEKLSSPSSNKTQETPEKKSLDEIIGGALEQAKTDNEGNTQRKSLDEIIEEALQGKKEDLPKEDEAPKKPLEEIVEKNQDDTFGYPEFDRWYELVQYEQMNNVRLPESVRKATKEKEKQWKEQQRKALRDDKVENPTWWDKTKAVGANVIEEFLFGWDLFAIDDRVELSSFGEVPPRLGAMANLMSTSLLVSQGQP